MYKLYFYLRVHSSREFDHFLNHFQCRGKYPIFLSYRKWKEMPENFTGKDEKLWIDMLSLLYNFCQNNETHYILGA